MNEVWREAKSEDAAAIEKLTRAAYAKWVAVIGRKPLPMQTDYSRALGEHAFTLVERDGALAGLVETEARGYHLYIVNVAVAEACQGVGLGSRLVGEAEAAARQQGFGEVRLMTNQLYPSNIRLYKRLGYEIYAEEAFVNGVAVWMRKRFDPGETR